MEVLSGTAGIQTDIAKRLKVDDSNVRRFLEKNPDMKLLQELEKEKELDIAEKEIFSHLRMGTTKDTKHLRFNKDFVKIRGNAALNILKNLGKDRGWVERQQREHTGDHPQKFELVNVDTPEAAKKFQEKNKKK